MKFYDPIKSLLRRLLLFFKLDLTENIKNDRRTKEVLKSILTKQSNCVDIGAHKGEILDILLSLSPLGHHIAIEPLPHLYRSLYSKYAPKIKVYPFAISNSTGLVSFQHVRNAEAYSGIKKRAYDTADPNIEEINVESRTLDEIVKSQIDLIKIDVEGGEYNVLVGAKKTITQYKPAIIFEFGRGASEYYGATPELLFNLLTIEHDYKIYNLPAYLNKQNPYTIIDFNECFISNEHYYFIAISQ